MRLGTLLRGDLRFQFKYGFYFIYLLFSVLYIALLLALPGSWREKTAVLMIFSDPAAMGLYFMGALILFEKSERVLDSIAVSPVKPKEYVLSKLISIGTISTAVGLAIGLTAGIVTNPLMFVAGLFLSSCLFSAIGLIVACKVTTLNQFIVATIPAEIVINVPAVLWLFGYQKSILVLHPGVCMIELLAGEGNVLLWLVLLFVWTALFTVAACRTVEKMLKTVGGAVL